MGEPGTKEVLSLEELEASVGLRTGRKHILSILVENKPGVLTRIAGANEQGAPVIERFRIDDADEVAVEVGWSDTPFYRDPRAAAAAGAAHPAAQLRSWERGLATANDGRWAQIAWRAMRAPGELDSEWVDPHVATSVPPPPSHLPRGGP